MAQDMFELHVIASDFAVPGKLYRAQVRALHPVNVRPVTGVRITSELKIGDEVVCRVEASRVANSGRYGRGMMLTEIGLPPGTDVDRASLENAVRDNGYSVNQYDVLPDRLVVYL